MPVELNELPLDRLFATLVDRDRLDRLVALALEEDLGAVGDVTTEAIVPPAATARAAIVARAAGTVAGLRTLEAILENRGRGIAYRTLRADGDQVGRGDEVLTLSGPLAAILPLERTLLNFLSRLSGVATRTREFVGLVAGTKAKVCDTRKTTPGWRELEKYAVRCGGGWLHRIGLFDAMLVKDNHLAAVPPDELADAVAAAAHAARKRHPLRFVEVEVDSLDQLDRLLGLPAGAIDIILLDNMDAATLAEAVRRRDARRPGLLLEASGGVRAETIRGIAATGVDRISVGSITHGATGLDFALDIASP
jgi:nicotinate-nucleotide pyrophosphorylase (carboxylating)